MSKPWPRRIGISGVKPYKLDYASVCNLMGDKDFFDNNIVRLFFGAVCSKEITEEQFRDRLAELWGANPQLQLHEAEFVPGVITYVLEPGYHKINIPANWPDQPVAKVSKDFWTMFNRCKTTDCSPQLGFSTYKFGVSGPGAINAPYMRPAYNISQSPSDTGIACNNLIGRIDDVKPYYYVVQNGDSAYSISQKFGQSGLNWHQMRDANYTDDFTLQDFTDTDGSIQSVCFWKDWFVGRKLKIPASWQDNPSIPVIIIDDKKNGVNGQNNIPPNGNLTQVTDINEGKSSGSNLAIAAVVGGCVGALLLLAFAVTRKDKEESSRNSSVTNF